MRNTTKAVRERLSATLKRLTKKKEDGGRGMKPEELALRFRSSTSSIFNWMAKRRAPGDFVIEKIEEFSGDKIL